MTTSVARMIGVLAGLDLQDPKVRCIADAAIYQRGRYDADVYMLDGYGNVTLQHVDGDAYEMLEHLDPGDGEVWMDASKACLFGPDIPMGWSAFRLAVYGIYCDLAGEKLGEGERLLSFDGFMEDMYTDYDAMYELLETPGYPLLFEDWQHDPEVLIAGD